MLKHNLSLAFALTALSLIWSACQLAPPVKTVHPLPPDKAETIPVEITHEHQPIPPAAQPAESASNLQVGPLTAQEIEKYGYELGYDIRKDLTLEQKSKIEKRKKRRELEKKIHSAKERQQYSKIIPWLKSDDEIVEFLSIRSLEGRQAWINRNKIWARAHENDAYTPIMDAQDIAIGMPISFVKKSWGEPDSIESSGNPIYKNERWIYTKQVSGPQGYHQEKRYVYFEGGRVIGWETE